MTHGSWNMTTDLKPIRSEADYAGQIDVIG